MHLAETRGNSSHLVAAVAATVAALVGCSDKFETDFAACKAETVEAYELRECMYQRGWLVRDACVGESHMWAAPDCYLR
jgi:hypothetical protein